VPLPEQERDSDAEEVERTGRCISITRTLNVVRMPNTRPS